MIVKKNLQDKIKGIISKDPEILNGTPVFKGTRVPLKNLFDYIETGKTIDNFLEDFPSVNKDSVNKIIEFAEEMFSTPLDS